MPDRYLDHIICLDFEASSLNFESYPIAAGWHGENGTTELLIKPAADWHDWEQASERIHGISRSQLQENGQSIETVCKKMNLAFKDKFILVDSEYDKRWNDVLFRAAGIKPTFKLDDLFVFIARRINTNLRKSEFCFHRDAINESRNDIHCAGADARANFELLEHFVKQAKKAS